MHAQSHLVTPVRRIQRTAPAGPELRDRLAELIGAAFNVPPAELSSKGRGKAPVAFARQVAIYLACTRLGLSYTGAGGLFGRDRTTAAHACRRVEEARERGQTDRQVERLDREIARLADQGGERDR